MPTFSDRIKTAWAALGGRGPEAMPAPSERATPPLVAASVPLGGQRGRLTTDGISNALGSFGMVAAARADRGRNWRARDLDSKTLDRISTPELIEMLADLSPEVNSALWHFVRFCNPGYEINAYQPGGQVVNEKAQALIDQFLARISQQHGAANVVFDQFFIGAYLRGAMFGEVILDDKGQPVGLVAVDPQVAEYVEADDPILGSVWLLGQKGGNGQFVPLAYPTIRYVPIDPLPGYAPYGRAMVTPAIFVCLFLIGLMHDLRRVVAQQGYPRIDIAILLENLRQAMPADQRENVAAFRAWVDEAIKDVQAAYAALQPDHAFVHTDVAQVNGAVGAIDSQSLGALDGIIQALERMIIRGLKAMPLALGHHDGSTETYANRAWEIHAATIKSVQHLAETMLGDLFTVALEAQGVAASVVVKFAELRASEMLRDEQTRAMQIANAASMYDRGWISQDAASELVTGQPADNWRPRFVSLQGSLDIVDMGISDADEIAAQRQEQSDARAQRLASLATRGRLIGEIRQAMAELDRLTGGDSGQ